MQCRSIHINRVILASFVAGTVAVAFGAVQPRRALAAESAAANPKQGREHFKRGQRAFAASRYDEAYREFESGYTLSGRPLFLVNMAHSDRRRGRLLKARVLYQKYLIVEPESKLRDEVEAVMADIDANLAAEAQAVQTSTTPAREPLAAPTTAARRPNLAAPPPGPEVTEAPSASFEPSEKPTPTVMLDMRAAPRTGGGDEPYYMKWWFWTGAGAVSAVALITVIVISSGNSPVKSGSLGMLGQP